MQPRPLRGRAGSKRRTRRTGRGARYVLSPDSHRDEGRSSRGSWGCSEGTLRGRMIERASARRRRWPAPPTSCRRARGAVPRATATCGASVTPGAAHRRARSGSRHAGVRGDSGPRTPSSRARRSRAVRSSRPRRIQAAAADRAGPAVPARRAAPASRGLGDHVASPPLLRRRRRTRAAGVQRGPHSRRRHGGRSSPGPLVTIEFTGDPLPKGQDRRARPDRARGIGRPGSAGGLGAPHHRIPESARLLEGGGDAARAPGRADGRLRAGFNVKRGRLCTTSRPAASTDGQPRRCPIEELRPFLKMDQEDVFVRSKLDATIGATRPVVRDRGFATVQVRLRRQRSGRRPRASRSIVDQGRAPRDYRPRHDQRQPERCRPIGSTPLLTLRVRGRLYTARSSPRDRDALLVAYLNARICVRGRAPCRPSSRCSRRRRARRRGLPASVEGPQVIVEHIFITGNVRTKQAVIQRELQLRQGRTARSRGPDGEPAPSQHARTLPAHPDFGDLATATRHSATSSSPSRKRIRRRSPGAAVSRSIGACACPARHDRQ